MNCSDLLITDPSGTISSPGYPDKYPPNADCSWTIESTKDSEHVYITLTLIMIEGPYGQCQYDYLQVYDGLNSSEPRAK